MNAIKTNDYRVGAVGIFNYKRKNRRISIVYIRVSINYGSSIKIA